MEVVQYCSDHLGTLVEVLVPSRVERNRWKTSDLPTSLFLNTPTDLEIASLEIIREMLSLIKSGI